MSKKTVNYLRVLTPIEGIKVKCIVQADGKYRKEDTLCDFTIGTGCRWIKIMLTEKGDLA